MLDPALACQLAEHSDANSQGGNSARIASITEPSPGAEPFACALDRGALNEGRTLLAAALRVEPPVRVLTHDQR